MLTPEEQQLLDKLDKLLPLHAQQQALKKQQAKDKALEAYKVKVEAERKHGHWVVVIYPDREEKVWIPGKE